MRCLLPPLSLAVLSALVVVAQAQSEEPIEGDPVPPRPADQIHDDARLLDEAARTEMQGQIQRLKDEVDVDLFVAAYTLLPGNIDDHAKALRDAWATKDRSLVMLYRRGFQQLTFSAKGDDETFIPSGELYKIYGTAVTAAQAIEEPRERIVTATRVLVDALIADLVVRDPARSLFYSRNVLLVACVAATALIIGILSFAVVRRLSRRRSERETAVLFPEVIVGRRLGAAYGGGTVAEIDFQKTVSTPSFPVPPSVR